MSASESCLASPSRTSLLAGVQKRALKTIGNAYCRVFHKAISRPVNGKYRCWHCLREFGLGW